MTKKTLEHSIWVIAFLLVGYFLWSHSVSSFGFADFALVFAFFGSVSIIVGFICAKPIFLQALCLDASEENIYPRIFVLLIAIVIAVFFVTQKVFA